MRITKTVEMLVNEAKSEINSISVDDAYERQKSGAAVLIDIRDIRELQRDGRIDGAFHAPRGMLEFWIDPASPYHKPYFAEDKLFVFYCASGWRSLLATEVAQSMGLRCASLRGGFTAWAEAQQPTVPHER